MVPVEEVDDAEDESSSKESRRTNSEIPSFSSFSSFSSNMGGSGGNMASFDFAKDLCRSLMLLLRAEQRQKIEKDWNEGPGTLNALHRRSLD
jgi:hypothetical protein